MSAFTGSQRAPLVSVTLTNFNYARFLPRAIESILQQSFEDFELIIIDNASTDDSLEVIGRYADPRIRLITHDANVGALASFRESCDVARGTYRLHLDADDWIIEPNAIERQVDMMQRHPDMAFVFSSLTMFDAQGRKTLVSRPHERDVVLAGEDALDDILGFRFGHSGLMFRLDLYRLTGGYPDDVPHIDDLVLAARLAALGSVGYIDAELYAFNQHGANVHMSPGRSVMRDEILPMIAEAFDGPLGARVHDAAAVRRRIERRALVHLPTAYIFTDRRREGWRLYWQSMRLRPVLTVAQPRTLSLVARTMLGARGFELLRRTVRRTTEPPGEGMDADGTSATARIAFITPSGWGNLGDAAIVDALVHALRARLDEPDIVGYTLHHLDTARRHGVEAHPLLSFSLPYYPVLPEGDASGYELPAYDGSAVASPGPLTWRRRLRDGVRRRLWAVRTVEFAVGMVRMRSEPADRRRLRRALAGTDAIVVAGGGQLDALFGGVWGQPYVLSRWGRLASQVGARFLVLSVGTGTLDAVERVVVRRALRRATYRSYRDPVSRDLIRAKKLTADDAVVPDLAYALPIRPEPLRPTARVRVGVSPMNYRHPDFYPAADHDRFDAHVRRMHRICEHALERGHEVVLFTTDASDDVGLAALTALLEATTAAPRRWTVAGARTVDELMALYASLDVVVAARLHGALLAHVAHRPVLALAHERKVRSLMSDVGHQRFCFDLGSDDEDELEVRFDELVASRAELAAEVGVTTARHRARVEAQFDALFGAPRTSSS